MLTRLPGWPEAFASALAHAQNQPFEWGRNDCCLFACNVVLAITGTDLARSFRGYSGSKEAFRVVARYGGIGRLAESIALEHGIPEIPPLRARRGDVCLFDTGQGETLGICRGNIVLAPGKDGLVGHPVSKLLESLRAWEIG